MNLNILFSHGTKYVDAALRNWDRRKTKLTTAWGNEHPDFRVSTPKKQRLNKIILELEDLIRHLIIFYHKRREEQEMMAIETENQYVTLFCSSLDCRYSPDAIGTAIRLKNYVMGEIKCPKCGKPLISEEDEQIDIMLLEMGIH